MLTYCAFQLLEQVKIDTKFGLISVRDTIITRHGSTKLISSICTKRYAIFPHYAKDITKLILQVASSRPNTVSQKPTIVCRNAPIAGVIIRARQIERQLQTYMKQVEDVLGKGWEHYFRNQRLFSVNSESQSHVTFY